MKFEVGDKVEYAGMEGEVTADTEGRTYRIKCDFTDIANKPVCVVFTEEGKEDVQHKEPLLKLISKAKKTRTFYEWIDNDGYISDILFTKDFKKVDGLKSNTVIFNQWTGRSFEIEVDW